MRSLCTVFLVFVIGLASAGLVLGQETQPSPGAPKSGQIPPVTEKKLANGLTVAVGERHAMPLVSIQLLVKSGAAQEDLARAGRANLTAALLTKGTKTRTATQIAEEIEFLGGSIGSGAGWFASSVNVTVTSDLLDQALAILADVVLDPSFKQDELDLLKMQTMDGLTYNLKQPGFLANYVSARYSYGEHPAGGTPESIERISREDIVRFHKSHYIPANAVLIFAGDVTVDKANAAAQKFFGKWPKGTMPPMATSHVLPADSSKDKNDTPRRILVVDLPNSGQAAVKYVKRVDTGRAQCKDSACTTSEAYFAATVMNAVLGGGYSSRLNQEIRIKRGLSYGAGSGFGWRSAKANFSTTTQTKSESAAEVAELVLAEVAKLGKDPVSTEELDPRRLVLTGDFGRDLETTAGLADRIADLYSFDLSPSELNSYVMSVRAVTTAQIRDYAARSLTGGDIVIVGDAKLFADDLKKRFPSMKVETIPADALDLSKESLRK